MAQQQPPERSGTNTGPSMQEQMATAMERVGEAAHSVGQKVTDFFQGNPFETPIGRKIELATDATRLATENWGLNMEICDFINCTNEGPRDAVRAIKKRLQTQMGKNNAIVMYTLTVLETCVKNCDMRFTQLVCAKEFVNELVKMISAKHDAPQIVQERILGIIQSWADAFRDTASLSGVLEVYEELRAKGVEFPPTDLDSMAPIITPKRTIFPAEDEHRAAAKPAPSLSAAQSFPPAQHGVRLDVQPAVDAAAQQFVAASGPISATPEQMAKLRSELDIVHVNLTVLRELIGQLKPQQPQQQQSEENVPADFHFIKELFATCKQMQQRVVELIPVVTNEEVTFELLSVNDELNATFDKYDRCMANFNAQGIDVTMVPSGSGTQLRAESSTTADLIDFGGGDMEKKAPVEQFQAIDIRNGDGRLHSSPAKATSTGANNEAYVHDQAEVGIGKVAFGSKGEPVVNETGGQKAAEAKKPEADDGL